MLFPVDNYQNVRDDCRQLSHRELNFVVMDQLLALKQDEMTQAKHQSPKETECLGAVKRAFRKTEVSRVPDIEQVIQFLSEVNQCQYFGNHTGDTIALLETGQTFSPQNSIS